MKAIFKYVLITLSLIIVIMIILVILLSYKWDPGYPPNDVRKDHEIYENKKIKIPYNVFDLEPNTLGLFIKDYKLFYNYDTSKVDFFFTIYNEKVENILSNEMIDTTIFYNKVVFGIDNKSYVHSLDLIKVFSKDEYKFKISYKDSIHNYVKKSIKSLKDFYGTNYKIYINQSFASYYENLEIRWETNGSYILLVFPNIYSYRNIKNIAKNVKEYRLQVSISIEVNATNDDFLVGQLKKYTKLTKSYTLQNMNLE